MMRRDAIHHQWILAVLRGHLHAQLYVRALVLVREHLAHVVQQRAALGHCHIQPELGRHDAGKVGHLLRMLQNVLPVARAPLHAPDELDELRMQSVHTRIVCRLFAGLDDGRVDFLLRLVDDFLDAARMDPAVGHQFLQRQPCHLAPDGIEARHHHRVGRVVNDHVHSRGELEGADVPPFAADDATLHLIVRQRHRGHRRLRRGIRRDTLDGERNDLLGFALRIAARTFADLAQHVCGIGVRFFLQPPDQLVLGVLRRHARHLLEPSPLIGHHLVQLVLPHLEQLFAATEIAGALADIAIALLHQFQLPVQRPLPVADASLLLLHERATRPQLLLGHLAQLHDFFLSRHYRAFTRVLDLALGIRDDAARGLFRRGARCRVSLDFRQAARSRAQPPTQKEKCRRGDDEHAQRGKKCHDTHVIYAPPRMSAEERIPPLLPRSASTQLPRSRPHRRRARHGTS